MSTEDLSTLTRPTVALNMRDWSKVLYAMSYFGGVGGGVHEGLLPQEHALAIEAHIRRQLGGVLSGFPADRML
jgi:hypothetical protein